MDRIEWNGTIIYIFYSSFLSFNVLGLSLYLLNERKIVWLSKINRLFVILDYCYQLEQLLLLYWDYSSSTRDLFTVETRGICLYSPTWSETWITRQIVILTSIIRKGFKSKKTISKKKCLNYAFIQNQTICIIFIFSNYVSWSIGINTICPLFSSITY